MEPNNLKSKRRILAENLLISFRLTRAMIGDSAAQRRGVRDKREESDRYPLLFELSLVLLSGAYFKRHQLAAGRSFGVNSRRGGGSGTVYSKSGLAV